MDSIKDLDCTVEYYKTKAESYYSVGVEFIDEKNDNINFSQDFEDASIVFEERSNSTDKMVGKAIIYLPGMDEDQDPEIIDTIENRATLIVYTKMIKGTKNETD